MTKPQAISISKGVLSNYIAVHDEAVFALADALEALTANPTDLGQSKYETMVSDARERGRNALANILTYRKAKPQ